MIVVCPECYKQITLTKKPSAQHIELTCPHCQKRVTVTVQRRIGAQERKTFEMCTPAGRFLGEYNPETTTVTIPYRGQEYEFDLRRTSTWPQRLHSD